MDYALKSVHMGRQMESVSHPRAQLSDMESMITCSLISSIKDAGLLTNVAYITYGPMYVGVDINIALRKIITGRFMMRCSS